MGQEQSCRSSVWGAGARPTPMTPKRGWLPYSSKSFRVVGRESHHIGGTQAWEAARRRSPPRLTASHARGFRKKPTGGSAAKTRDLQGLIEQIGRNGDLPNTGPDLGLFGANLVWLYGDQLFDCLHLPTHQQHIGDLYRLFVRAAGRDS